MVVRSRTVMSAVFLWWFGSQAKMLQLGTHPVDWFSATVLRQVFRCVLLAAVPENRYNSTFLGFCRESCLLFVQVVLLPMCLLKSYAKFHAEDICDFQILQCSSAMRVPKPETNLIIPKWAWTRILVSTMTFRSKPESQPETSCTFAWTRFPGRKTRFRAQMILKAQADCRPLECRLGFWSRR